MPAAGGGDDRRIYDCNSAEAAQTVAEVVVFHEWDMAKAVELEEDRSGDKDGLISVWQLPPAGTHVGSKFNQSQQPAVGIYGEAKRAADSGLQCLPDMDCEVEWQLSIRVQKQQNLATGQRPPRVQRMAGPYPTHQYHYLFGLAVCGRVATLAASPQFYRVG